MNLKTSSATTYPGCATEGIPLNEADTDVGFVIKLKEIVLVSTQGNRGPMVLDKCLALANCIHSKSDLVCLLFTEF